MILKNYTLTPEVEAEVEKVIAEGQEKYKDISHIICERNLTEEELHACGYYDGLEE